MHAKTVEMKSIQQQHAAKIDNVRKEQLETLEKLRVEMLKREEERTRQWMESEKETLHVLNGVSNLLDLSEKLDKSESEKIIKKLDEIYEKVLKISTT
jgi:negative regulator of sigma E activity